MRVSRSVITYTFATIAAAEFHTRSDRRSTQLTDLDFVDEKGGKDPLQVERVDVFSLPTIQRVEVLSRGNQYSALPVEARDQSQIEIFGPRVGTVIQAHEICDEFVMGPLIAQTILQRELYVRAKFSFKLSWEYCLLDPMDILTVTDVNLGLSNYPVRIIQIEEDDKGLLSFTCEELVAGVSSPAYNPSASSSGLSGELGRSRGSCQHATHRRAANVLDEWRGPDLDRSVRHRRRAKFAANGAGLNVYGCQSTM